MFCPTMTFWPTWKRYSYVPLWVSGHLDLTMDFPTCHYSWLFRKTFWKGIWMLVFSLSPLKLRCLTMTTMHLKKRYRFEKTPLKCQNVVRHLNMMAFLSVMKMGVTRYIFLCSSTFYHVNLEKLQMSCPTRDLKH